MYCRINDVRHVAINLASVQGRPELVILGGETRLRPPRRFPAVLRERTNSLLFPRVTRQSP